MCTLNVQLIVDTIQMVCARISEATHIPVEQQQLFFNGQELQHDARPLVEHGVIGNSEVHLVKLGTGSKHERVP